MNQKKHFTFRTSIISFFIFFVFGGQIFGSPQPTNSSPPDFSKLIPANQNYRSEAMTVGGKVHFWFTYQIKVDNITGEILVEVISDEFQFSGRFDQFFQVKESVVSFGNSQIVDYFGHDRRESVYDERKKKVVVKYFKEHNEIKIKELNWDNRSIDSDIISIYLQGMLLKGVDHFKGNLIIKSKGLILSANFQLSSACIQDFPPKNGFPGFFQDFTSRKEAVNIYEMSFNGVPGLLYPTKFYFAYKKTPPGKYFTYWGGTGLDEEYFIFSDMNNL